ncbi:hypothetical protein PSYJA_47258, partial [Pseudomonas syringae pv. japonica str. M301072]
DAFMQAAFDEAQLGLKEGGILVTQNGTPFMQL